LDLDFSTLSFSAILNREILPDCPSRALYLNQRISGREHVRIQLGAGIRRKGNVADLGCSIESGLQRTTTIPDMFCPWQDMSSERQIGSGLKALQPTTLDKFIAEPTKSISGLVVAETRSGEHAQPHIRETRTVAVAVLEAEINRATDGKGKKVQVGEQSGRI